MKKPFILLAVLAGLAACERTAAEDPRGALTLSRDALVFNAGGAISSDTRTVRVGNTGGGTLSLNEVMVTGEDAERFALSPSGPLELAAGESRELAVTFTPAPDGSVGPQRATLLLRSEGAEDAVQEVYLGGLTVTGQEGTLEPSLQWILDAYGLPIATGDPDPTNSALTDGVVNGPVGEEVWAQTFRRADPTKPVSAEVIAAFGVPDVAPVFEFGFYSALEAEPTRQKLLSLPTDPPLNGQRLEPVIQPEVPDVEAGRVVRFEPPAGPFGFYSFWPTTRFFDERTVFTEKRRNTFPGAAPHHVRVYPLKTRGGAVVEDAFVLATDESVRLFDFNDAVVVVRNVRPVETSR